MYEPKHALLRAEQVIVAGGGYSKHPSKRKGKGKDKKKKKKKRVAMAERDRCRVGVVGNCCSFSFFHCLRTDP